MRPAYHPSSVPDCKLCGLPIFGTDHTRTLKDEPVHLDCLEGTNIRRWREEQARAYRAATPLAVRALAYLERGARP